MVYRQKVVLLKAAKVLQCFATRAMYRWKSFSGSVTIIFWDFRLRRHTGGQSQTAVHLVCPKRYREIILPKKEFRHIVLYGRKTGSLSAFMAKQRSSSAIAERPCLRPTAERIRQSGAAQWNFIFAMDRHGRYGAIRESIRGLTGSAKLLPAES